MQKWLLLVVIVACVLSVCCEDDAALLREWRAAFGGARDAALLDDSVHVQRSVHTHGRSWAHVVVTDDDVHARLHPPLVDMWELTRYDDALALLDLARRRKLLARATPFELVLTASDHFSLDELLRKAGGTDSANASCAARGSCLVWAATRWRGRAPRDRYTLLYPGFEFAVQRWFESADALAHYVARFDRKRPHRARSKRAAAVWRGSPNGVHFAPGEWARLGSDGNARARLVALAHNSTLIDARFVSMPEQEREWAAREPAFADADAAHRMPMDHFAAYRAIIDVDGGGWSARLPALMAMNSVVLKMQTQHDTMYMADLSARPDDSAWLDESLDDDGVDAETLVERWLSPSGRAPNGVVWFRDDLSDLEPLVRRINALPLPLLARIVERARRYVREQLVLPRVLERWAVALQRYADALDQSDGPLDVRARNVTRYVPCRSARTEAECEAERPGVNVRCQFLMSHGKPLCRFNYAATVKLHDERRRNQQFNE